VLAITTLFLSSTFYLRQIIVTAAVGTWGLRLSGYLLMRILRTGKDERFDSLNRGFSLQFAAFWIGQAVWVC
jgi:steroid 5-alpha reductase family enzyme